MELLKGTIVTLLLALVIAVILSVAFFTTTKCPECGKRNDNDVMYCDACGYTLRLFCDVCGEENENNAECCKECGHAFNTVA